MKIELHEITIRDIARGYLDNAEEGVYAYNGKLNIRPPYQREFVYDSTKRDAVLKSIRNNFPLNVMYWVKHPDGTFEVLDGQQRTISFCQYVNGDFSIEDRAFHNLTTPEKEQILNYKTMIYFCEGNDQEKLDWFAIVNIAGEKFTEQELRNAVYTGPWLAHAKSIFSKTQSTAYLLSQKYVTGSPIRQELLETALDWISKGKIRAYMSVHQHDPNADELWTYYRDVIEWVEKTFPVYRKEMKGVNWGPLYDEFSKQLIDAARLEIDIRNLMMDDDVTNKKGIYPFVLTREEKHLNIRAFTDSQKRSAYERQRGYCLRCNKPFAIDAMEADHIAPWHVGGKTTPENCQMLCKDCNRRKSGK